MDFAEILCLPGVQKRNMIIVREEKVLWEEKLLAPFL